MFAQGTSTPYGFGTQVSVFLGDGKGGFTLRTQFTTGGSDAIVAIGDFNNDGKPDLAVESGDAGETFIYLGVGDGTFVGAGALNASGYLAVADLNNDGNLDIAVAVPGGSAVLVFPGDGTGNFGPPVSLPVGANPSWVAIGDFNGDGKPDIACIIDSSASVTVLLNQGGLSFASAGSFQVGNEPDGRLLIADFNHDGNLDVATVNFSGSVTVLTGDGSGHLGNRVDIPISLNDNGGAAPDLNGDGLPDLVVPDQIEGAVSVLINNTQIAQGQTITFTGTPATAVYNQSFAVSATASSGLPVTITASGVCMLAGNTVTMTSGTGTCALTASQAGNASYSPAANVVNTVTAQTAMPTVTFTGAPASAAYGSNFAVAAATNASTTAAITASGACSVAGSTVTMTSGTGNCQLTANWAADSNYSAASATQLTVAIKVVPAVNWSNPAAIVYGTALSTAQLNATASAQGTFVYNPPAGTVLSPGSSQTLSVAFTPTAILGYTTASATVYINVVFTGLAPASGTLCNGAYDGTFKGNLTVSAGQTCIFFGGGVTGNIIQTGGDLILIGATVGGNVQVQGGGMFSFSASAVIKGNLQVQGVPAGSAQNLVCGVNVKGDLQYQNNGAPIEIGAASTCAGDTVGGDIQIQNNTAATSISGNTVAGTLQVENNMAATSILGNTVAGNLQVENNPDPTTVFNNAVKGILQCSGNTAITGGGNTAAQKQGQCAAF
ncbi:MAG: VCBS repeat-containing protein [Bryobacteraceae bacterium]